MLQRTVFINKFRMLQGTDVTTNECYNEQFLSINSGCYNKEFLSTKSACYNEQMLQRTVFINKFRMLQRTRKNTISRRNTCVLMTCRALPLWLDRQSSSLLSFVRISYQFSSVISLFASLARKINFFIYSAI